MEDERLLVHQLTAGTVVKFVAFLDGVQESRPVSYLDGIPLVLGNVAAAIRVRSDRRMSTWPSGRRHLSKLYAPRKLLPENVASALEVIGYPVVDTLGARPNETVHPYELLRLAVHAVQSERQQLERELDESWCASVGETLYVDGGLPWGELSSRAACCVGVVKTHHTLYAADDEIKTVLAMPQGSRSSVFMLERHWGPTVASWYLRLRDPRGHDPMWGLVRVEVAMQSGESVKMLSERADDVTRWVLAERAPLSLPDSRWHTMAYGIRDCEEYLRAVAN